MHKNSRIFK